MVLFKTIQNRTNIKKTTSTVDPRNMEVKVHTEQRRRLDAAGQFGPCETANTRNGIVKIDSVDNYRKILGNIWDIMR